MFGIANFGEGGKNGMAKIGQLNMPMNRRTDLDGILMEGTNADGTQRFRPLPLSSSLNLGPEYPQF
jgi:hypothetical protein